MSKSINISICFILLLLKVGYSQDRTKVNEVETHTYILEKEGLKTGYIDTTKRKSNRTLLTENNNINIVDKLQPVPKIFIKGRVHENPNYNNFIPYATVLIKGTKIHSISDSLGFYSIDVTGIADTAKKIVLTCKYIAHENKEVTIDNKLNVTMVIDLNLVAEPSCNYPEIELKSKRKKK